jgi:hypothetical protein
MVGGDFEGFIKKPTHRKPSVIAPCVFYFLFVTGPVLDDVILGCNLFILA